MYDFEKQWLSSFVCKAIVIRPVPQVYFSKREELNFLKWEKIKGGRFNLAYGGWNG